MLKKWNRINHPEMMGTMEEPMQTAEASMKPMAKNDVLSRYDAQVVSTCPLGR